ncbi:protein RRP6-like 3 isoform X3 [Phoenix dactylifera]|uniref:Protein RRP6-like 3 isoform X3 n=1 Tax=Phoenix dactylifera TaxID=42345 RepID=A0A8B9AWJ9_PHODC|nr:protein RRP6-like 3 isoform X3 [Phoenix dactylifera]
MATRGKINAIVAVACVAAASLVVAALCRRLWRRRVAGRRCCSELEDKPQNRFKHVLADNSYAPFRHFKREGTEEVSLKMHPFEEEITSLLENPPALLNFVTVHEYSDMSASYVWIDTEHQLDYLAKLLSKEQVFAVDTEQHSLRSFIGFTALMQISTEREDFLIDTIALHDVMDILRPVFADPSICKVFHGADNDVLWLQRDFHIYVVNMFDTAKACEILSKPHKSLAYLLETYCGVSTDKTLQREDWRVRPLSVEMIEYARSDAHYLLYIADCLASELQSKSPDTSACPDDKFNFFFEASHRSNMVCMQLYAKEIESTPGASAAASILSRNLSVQGVTSWKSCEIKDLIWKLCAWRDLMARIHDESLRYVLSDQAIVSLAMRIPKEPTEVYDVIQQADLNNGSSNIYSILPSPSPVVSTHIEELCFLLQEVSANIDDVFRRFLQKHLGPTGCCPLSVYNYALLSEFCLKQTNELFMKHAGEKFTSMVGKKASRELFVQKFSCKSPVYHNCRIYASDGRLLCYCDRRKLEWYLKRDLAKIVEDDPPAIMLLFEPKGRPEDEDNDFYIQSKKNICVGCGEKNHYLRYRIIPSCYRMHFPEHLKSHRSHDIVLLCVDCHEIAHSAAEKFKKQIAEEFGIPLFVRMIVDSGESTVATVTSKSVGGIEETGVSPLQLRTAAMALLRHGSSMPARRHEELMQVVKAYFGGREISREDLEMALLVGMSPHERRRLEKKKGLSLRHHAQSIICKSSTSSNDKTIENNIKRNNSIHISQESLKDDVKDTDGRQTNTSASDMHAVLLLNRDDFPSGNIQCPNKTEELELGNVCVSSNGNGHGALQKETCEAVIPSTSYQVTSSKSAKKLSLLGHGPHGKQVVEHLLNKYGEDGILQFCQRWRQVFVDAIHPRFLPSGWDIMHSGRRDFGEYSVYNPARKDLQTADK